MPHVLTPATSIRHHFSPKRSAFGWTAPLPGSLFSGPPSMLSVFFKYKRGCVFSRLHLPVQHSTCRSTSLALTSPRSCHNAAQATLPPLFPEDALPSLNASVPPSPSWPTLLPDILFLFQSLDSDRMPPCYHTLNTSPQQLTAPLLCPHNSSYSVFFYLVCHSNPQLHCKFFKR